MTPNADEMFRRICRDALSEVNEPNKATDAAALVELELLAVKLQELVLLSKRDGLFPTLWSVVR